MKPETINNLCRLAQLEIEQCADELSAFLREEAPAPTPDGEEIADSREPLWLSGGSLIDAHARDMQAAIRHLFARFEHEGTASQKRQALHDLLVRELNEAHLNALIAGVPAAKRRVLRLRALRRSREMTQAELARRAGLSTPYVCEIEKGKATPSLDTAKALARVLGVTVDEAFDYIEVPA